MKVALSVGTPPECCPTIRMVPETEADRLFLQSILGSKRGPSLMAAFEDCGTLGPLAITWDTSGHPPRKMLKP